MDDLKYPKGIVVNKCDSCDDPNVVEELICLHNVGYDIGLTLSKPNPVAYLCSCGGIIKMKLELDTKPKL